MTKEEVDDARAESRSAEKPTRLIIARQSYSALLRYDYSYNRRHSDDERRDQSHCFVRGKCWSEKR
jgi:hypothetical protein